MANPSLSSDGEIQGNIHVLNLRVYYEDTDAQGVVYYANYLKYFERGRTEMLRACGIDQSALLSSQSEATFFVVKTLNVDYKKPARLDDILCVKTTLSGIKAASLRVEQEIFCGEDRIATANVKVGVLGGDGRPKKLTDALRQKMQGVMNENGLG